MRHAARYLFACFLLVAAAWSGVALAATSTLTGIGHDTLPGGVVQLRLQFNGPVPQPKIFTTHQPARIALDFPDTSSMAPRHTELNVGATDGVTAVSAGGRTRVLVDLVRPSNFRSRVEGDTLLLTVGNGTDNVTTTTAATIDPTKALPSAMDGPAIASIDFRRGPNGDGRVLIDFSGPGADANLRQENGLVIVTINHANLPARLAQRLDTLDFATPVQSISTRARMGGGVRMEIAVKGDVDASSYQSGNQYVVDVAAKQAPTQNLAGGGIDKGLPAAYTGSRVTFNFQDIPVRSALQLIADISGLNLVAADSVGGNLTLRLVNVPWDQALEVILRAKGLDQRRDGNVIWIAPQKEMADYEQSLAEARIKAENDAPLVTSYIPISYGKAKDIAKLLTTGSLQSNGGGGGGGGQGGRSTGFLSERGSVSYDERTNTLLLNETPEKTKQLRALIAVLDKPVQQVLIESRVVIASDSFTRELGAKFGINASRNNPSGQTISVGGGLQTTGSTTGAVTGAGGLNVSLPNTDLSAGSIALALLGKNYALDMELDAAQSEGRTEIISSPRVITANQQEADIRQGQEIGYVTYQNSTSSTPGAGTATVQFKDAVLELKVTPTITSDDRVFLLIDVKKDSLDHYITVPGSGQVPIINTQEVNTSVLVDNGQTVVLGGIYQVTRSNSVTKVPGLGDIPVLGALFRSKTRQNDKAELLIFVTPRILSETSQ